MNLKMARPDKYKWPDGEVSGERMKQSMTVDPTGDMITIKRRNGQLQMKMSEYAKLSKSAKDRLHKAWEENDGSKN